MALIGFYTRPTRMDSDTSLESCGGNRRDALFLYDGDMCILTRLVSVHYNRNVAILISEKRPVAVGMLR